MIFLANQITVATIEQCLSEPTLLKVNIWCLYVWLWWSSLLPQKRWCIVTNTIRCFFRTLKRASQKVFYHQLSSRMSCGWRSLQRCVSPSAYPRSTLAVRACDEVLQCFQPQFSIVSIDSLVARTILPGVMILLAVAGKACRFGEG